MKFSFFSLLWRALLSFGLVIATYNPFKPYSFYYWVIEPLVNDLSSIDAYKALASIVLLILWSFFLRATYRSLGLFGTILAVLFFAALIWVLIQSGLITFAMGSTVVWLCLIAISGVLTVGISWSHVRRRITGQVDVDEADI